MSLWLTAEELEELTGFKTPRRQKLALAEMRVPFLSRAADGFPLVARDFQQRCISQSTEKRRIPKLDFLREG